MVDLRLDWCSHDAAKYAVENWHYSGSLPVPPRLTVGVWEDDVFTGSIIYSRGASSTLGAPYNCDQTETCELTRVALDTHETPVTRLMSISRKLLVRKCPGLRVIVSFADPYHDHIGTIYQADNWYYLGTTDTSKEYIAPNGKKYHSRQVSEKGYNIQFGEPRRCWKPSECETIHKPGKHRYVFPLADDVRDRVEQMAKPYPEP